jgi:hypothetical protein
MEEERHRLMAEYEARPWYTKVDLIKERYSKE